MGNQKQNIELVQQLLKAGKSLYLTPEGEQWLGLILDDICAPVMVIGNMGNMGVAYGEA